MSTVPGEKVSLLSEQVSYACEVALTVAPDHLFTLNNVPRFNVKI